MRKIRIEGDGVPRNTRVFLDDQEISEFINAIEVRIAANEAPTVRCEMVGYVSFSDEMVAHIEGLELPPPYRRDLDCYVVNTPDGNILLSAETVNLHGVPEEEWGT